ncbi:hypothetical protein GXW82_36460 [Streptacidiphilus sp. 4-A2]|nr:hypothetical protein [Streptacidiphilus sp. 4-A2]
MTYIGLRLQRKELSRQQGELETQQEQINEQRELTRQQTAWITAQLSAQRKAQARRIEAEGKSDTFELAELGLGNYQYVRVINKSDRPIYNISCIWSAGDAIERPYLTGQVSTP